MFKTVLILLGFYILFRLVTKLLPGKISRTHDKEKSGDGESLGIREEDIRDAEFKDIEEKS